jgi:hypothetical protein
MMQLAAAGTPEHSCYSTSFDGFGRAPSFVQVFTPGACPVGYTTAVQRYAQSITTAVCCKRYGHD